MGFSGHHTRKRFGQHWLRDKSVLQLIIEAADLQSTDRVLEVGPGRGALTERLLAAGLKAVETVLEHLGETRKRKSARASVRDVLNHSPRPSRCHFW